MFDNMKAPQNLKHRSFEKIIVMDGHDGQT